VIILSKAQYVIEDGLANLEDGGGPRKPKRKRKSRGF
jgi:hypothetical protein